VQGENKLVDADTPLSDFAGPTIYEKNVSAVGSGGNKTGSWIDEAHTVISGRNAERPGVAKTRNAFLME